MPTDPISSLEQQRRDKRSAAAALGADPYGQRTDDLIPLAAAAALYDPAADAEQKERGKEPGGGFTDRRPVVNVAGRVVLHRDNGKLIWLNLRDSSGDLQIAVSQRDCKGGGGFDLAKLTDLGDLVIARGPLVKTKTGETTVWASEFTAAAKCLITPPEKHAGLTDVELRYRQRYVDIWANPETLKVFELRSRIISCLRRELEKRAYLEVETPMLQTLAGGAAARPFITHMNALDISLYLRIAPELYLKRLLVGGFPKVYEINRNFRNEGLDKQHNPEFTMLEAYAAYGDVQIVMDLTEGLIRAAASEISNLKSEISNRSSDLTLPFGDLRINYAEPFARAPYPDLFERALGFSMTDKDRVRAEADKRHAVPAEALKKLDHILLVNALFEGFAEKSLDPARPTFITDYPAAISPLTRPRRDNPALAERADLFIGGMEIAPHYTELNDPDIQEAKFREQLAGEDAEGATFRTFDADFINALKVGMPPAGGMGLGIDRLVMLLTDQRTIRDVVLFPMMRPLSEP